MTARIRGAVHGIRAALEGRAWIESGRWSELLAPGTGSCPPARDAPTEAALPAAVAAGDRAAVLTLRLLARVPGGGWRTTCLYRSVARCLLRRRLGFPGHVELGVREADGSVAAHAWIREGVETEGERRGWTPLRGTGRPEAEGPHHPARSAPAVGRPPGTVRSPRTAPKREGTDGDEIAT